jgi:Caspase domain
MRWWLAILLLLVSGSAQAQTVRGLFVGIDKYRYSESPAYPRAAFKNLSGAVGDAMTFKKVLQDTHQLRLDTPVPGQCMSSNDISTTLTDDCATRDAILGALNAMVAKSKPKDTLLFYFAGHGAQFGEVDSNKQATGYNGTILPTDARQPGVPTFGDIFDTELKAIKDAAVAKGLYFVTIFDSCNSGSATRDPSLGEGRNAPLLTGTRPVQPEAPPPTGPGGGYWVHMAAAQDGETAYEAPSGAVGSRKAGIFTTALAQSMQTRPGATFGDLIRDVRARISANGRPKQTPMAEGKLTASLGSAARAATTFNVEQKDGRYVIAAGALSAITEGSAFALFETQDAAFAPNAVPLTIGRATTVEDYAATLEIENPGSVALKPALVALETQHAYGKAVVAVANRIADASEKAAVQRAIDAVSFASAKGKATVQITTDTGNKGKALLKTIDGQLIGSLGQIADARFADNVRIGLNKILRVEQLLKLSQGSDLNFCIDDTIYDPSVRDCPEKERRDLRVLKVGQNALVTAHNLAEAPRHLYVFGIDPSYGVALVLPAPGAVDPKLPDNQAYRNEADPVALRMPGIYRFVTIATDEPITPSALEQEGIARRGAATCNTLLEQILCSANSGKRSGTPTKASRWSAVVETVIVE